MGYWQDWSHLKGLKKFFGRLGWPKPGFISGLPAKLGLRLHEPESELSPEEKMCKEIWQAHQDWIDAINNFDYIKEQDLVDYSIYNIETNQKKYMYLLKKAREQNVIVVPLKNIDRCI